MISLRMPGADRIGDLFEQLADANFSYSEVGATCGEVPEGYNVDRYSTVLGHGDSTFELAKQAIRDWVPFQMPWIRITPQSEPRKEVLAAIVIRIVGLWWTNISRVIYTVDEPDRFGFAYGTLPFHAETGEELFLVERSRESGQVTYRILAFSNPRHILARLGYPLSRAAQRRFGVGSLEAMRRAASRSDV